VEAVYTGLNGTVKMAIGATGATGDYWIMVESAGYYRSYRPTTYALHRMNIKEQNVIIGL